MHEKCIAKNGGHAKMTLHQVRSTAMESQSISQLGAVSHMYVWSV